VFYPARLQISLDLVLGGLGISDILHHLAHLFFDLFLGSVLPPDLATHGSIGERLLKVPETVLCNPLVGRPSSQPDELLGGLHIENGIQHMVQCVVGEGDEDNRLDLVVEEYPEQLLPRVTLGSYSQYTLT